MLPVLLQGLLEVAAPTRCLSCRCRGPMPWCAVCQRDVREVVAACARCATPRDGAHHCWPHGSPIASTRAVYDYRGPVAAAVVTAKVGGARSGWPWLADLLAQRVARRPPEVDAVSWVTTAPGRRRQRGLDHAEVLARAVAGALEVPAVGLLDTRPTGPGTEDFQARHALPGTELLLVDDVLTTGATALRAAEALCRAGAGRIHLAVLARAGTHTLAGSASRHAPRTPSGRAGARPPTEDVPG